VPPEDVLAEHVQNARDEALTDLVTTELARLVDTDAVVRRLLDDHPDLGAVDETDVRQRLTDHPTESWRAAAKQLIDEHIDAADDLAAAVREQLAEQLRAADNDDDETGDRP